MAESKRTFHTPGINRDLDDRLLPDGQYRDGLNINVGRSEGDDVGAIENLKGNELIPGQDSITGQTIGSVRDQNSNTIYWFTTSATEDAIHEYDADTNRVTTLIRDNKRREAPLPTCTPELQARITEPAGNTGTRPPTPDLPAPPVGGCTDPAAANFNPNADFDDGSCRFPAPFSVSISGGGSGFPFTSTQTLTASTSGEEGAVTYSWVLDGTTTVLSTTNTLSVTQPGGTYRVTATDAGPPNRTAQASASVTFGAAAVPVAPAADISGLTSAQLGTNVRLSGAASSAGNNGAGTNYTITSYNWTVPAPATIVSGGGTNDNSVTITSPSEGSVAVTLTVTNSNRETSPVDTHNISFTAAPQVPFTWTASTGDTIANASSTGSVTINGNNVGTAQNVSFTSGVSPDTGFDWLNGTPPSSLAATIAYAGAENGANLTLTQNGASATIAGTVDMGGSATITWAGATVLPVFTPTCSVNDGNAGEAVTFTTNLLNASVSPTTYTAGTATYTVSGTIPAGFSTTGTAMCMDTAVGAAAANPTLTISNITGLVNLSGSTGQFLPAGVHGGFRYNWALSGVPAGRTPFDIEVTTTLRPNSPSPSPSGQTYFTRTNTAFTISFLFDPSLSGSAGGGGGTQPLASATPGDSDSTGLRVFITENSSWTGSIDSARIRYSDLSTSPLDLAGTTSQSGLRPQ